MGLSPETLAALALRDAGIPAAAIDRMVTALGVTPIDTAEQITAKVESLRSDLPGVFAEADPAGSGSHPSSGSGSSAVGIERGREIARERAAGGAGGESDYDRGARLARERYPHLALRESPTRPPAA